MSTLDVVRLRTHALAQNRADPRVCVLHVVHRVVVALLLGELDVEVERLVGGAAQEEVAGRIGTHVVEKLLERHHLAGALGHANDLAAPEQVHELADDDGELAGMPESGNRRLHALDVAVMVGAPQVDDAVESAVELVLVVRDVGREVRVVAVGLLQHAVLVIVEIRRPEPRGSVEFVDVAGFSQGGDCRLDLASARHRDRARAACVRRTTRRSPRPCRARRDLRCSSTCA